MGKIKRQYMPHMEITLETIHEARALGITKEYTPYLKRFKNWDTLSVDKLVLGKIKKNTQSFWSQANLIKARLAHPAGRNRRYALKSLAEIINFQKAALAKAIHTTSVNHLLIFLETHRYFQIPFEDHFADISFTQDQLTDLAKVILPFFTRNSFEIKAERDLNNHERININIYHQGVSDDNIEDVYSLIHQMECGRGIELPFRLRWLLWFLFEINFDAFCEYTDSLTTPAQFVAAMEWMTDKQLYSFFKNHMTDNKWLIFEGIRHLLEKNPNPDSLEIVRLLLNRMYALDNHFFAQICKYKRTSLDFNQALGACLASVPELKAELINELSKINQYTFFIKNKDKLLDSFLSAADDDRIKLLLSTIHEKWLNYTNQVLHDKDFNVLNPVLTDYAKYIVQYLTRFCTIGDRKKLWEEAFLAINNIDSRWHRSRSSRSTYFMIIFARLFIFTLSLRDSKHRDFMKDRFESLFRNSIFMTRYFDSYSHENLLSIADTFSTIKEILKIEADLPQ